MSNEKQKTHWLQNPNKNYLGHWDLPGGNDLTLTIKSAKWEEVLNPVINKADAKRVVRFEEDVKPFIVNQTNAQSIIDSTGVRFMEDSSGKQITLYVSSIMDRRTKQNIDCIRVRSKAANVKRVLKEDTTPFKNACVYYMENNHFEAVEKRFVISDEVKAAIKAQVNEIS